MSANKWTPGPWNNIDNSWEMSTVYDQHERVIAEVPIDGMCDEHTQDVYEPIKDANARLIAAAPELYEALEMALPRLAHAAQCAKINPTEKWSEHGSWDFSGCVCEISKVRAALAKARGDTP